MTCPTQLADAWRQRSGNDQARLIENQGPRRRAVPSPHLVIEAQGAALEGREGVHVNRHRVADNLVEELLTQFDLALPQRALVGPLGVPPERGAIGDQRVYGGLAALMTKV